jgi:hypothetical protein
VDGIFLSLDSTFIPGGELQKVRIKIRTFAFLIAGFMAVCSPLLAHHGAAAYDMSKPVEIKNAVITKYSWINPHVLIYFDAMDDKGEVKHWGIETGSPSAIAVMGWTRATLKVGEVVTIWLFQTKTGVPVGRLNKLQFADGRLMRDTQVGANDGSRSDDGLR